MSTKVYYGPYATTDDQYLIVPAPMVTISNQPTYANDHMIGYSHIITLNGYASAFVAEYTESTDGDSIAQEDGGGGILTNEDGTEITISGGISTSTSNQGEEQIKQIRKVLDRINYVKTALSKNGKFLTIRDDKNNTILIAKGGTLRSLSFDNNQNGWVAYAAYTAELEFNEIEFLGEHIPCGSVYVDNSTLNKNLVDFGNYKIKEFNDNWSFSIVDDSFGVVKTSDSGGNLNIHNSRINISYTVSATGKNYYQENENKLLPAWQQAKNFCQYRLFRQVQALNATVLSVGPATCSATEKLNSINKMAGKGVLGDIDSKYGVYNETVNVDCSESEGTCSITYNAILKRNSFGKFDSGDTIHTISKTKSRTKEGGKKYNVTISVNGTIEGLQLGGLVKAGSNFSIPHSGSLFVAASGANKYSAAAAMIDSVVTDDDLVPALKSALNITFAELEVNLPDCPDLPGSPIPASVNVTRNFFDGTINYSVEYNSTANLSVNNATAVTNSTINVTYDAPVVAEFVVPDVGVIIQDMNTVTARKINYTIEGRVPKECCLYAEQITAKISGGCAGIPMPNGLIFPDDNDYVLIDKKYSQNLIEGTYTLNLGYQCSTPCYV